MVRLSKPLAPSTMVIFYACTEREMQISRANSTFLSLDKIFGRLRLTHLPDALKIHPRSLRLFYPRSTLLHISLGYFSIASSTSLNAPLVTLENSTTTSSPFESTDTTSRNTRVY